MISWPAFNIKNWKDVEIEKHKKILGTLLAFGMISSFATVVNAENTIESAPTGVKILTAAENENYYNSLTDEEREKNNEKIQLAEKDAEEYEKRPQARAAAATKISIPGTFNMYQQTTAYYCSPATAKSIVQYLTGSSDSQSTIATALGTTSGGTDPTKVPTYLNDKQSGIWYLYSANPTQTTLLNNLYHDIVTMDAPSSLAIANASGANWHYATTGHMLAVNAIYDDKSKIQLADPLGGTQSGWAYYYEKTAAVASSVTFAVIW